MQISTAAIRLKDEAEKQGAYYVLQLTYPGRTVPIPCYRRMAGITIDEMNLSVRASNALKRCGAMTMGQVAELMEGGLKTVRNLGAKSEKEVIRSFFTVCYANMTNSERLSFWQDTVDRFDTP